MLDLRLTRNVLGLATLAVALTACGSDDPTGPGGSLNPTAVAEARTEMESALDAPVIYSLLGEPGMSASLALKGRLLDVNGATTSQDFDGPTAAGISAAVRTILKSGMLANAVAEPNEREDWYVDPELWGKTYVKYGPDDFRWDPNRTGSPARGVRVALYQRTGISTHNNTIVGWLDVMDSSTTTGLIGRIDILDAEMTEVATFRATSSETEATGGTSFTVSETFTGTLGLAPEQFVVADTISGTRSADGESANLRWHSVSKADFAGVSYSLLVTGWDDASGESAEAEIEITVGGHTTRIEGAGAVNGDGNTDIFIDDQLVAKVTYDAETEEETITGPNGGQVSQQVEQYVTAVFGVLHVLPNPLILHFVVFGVFYLI